MTKRGLVTVREGVGRDEAMRLLHKHRIEKLIVVDEDRLCVGLITVKDIKKRNVIPMLVRTNKDACGSRRRLALATWTGTRGSAARRGLRCRCGRYRARP